MDQPVGAGGVHPGIGRVPALALRKSTIYGILGATGIVVFAVAENVLSAAVEMWLDLPGFIGSVLAGVLVALGILPFRGVLRRWMQRRALHAVSRKGFGESDY